MTALGELSLGVEEEIFLLDETSLEPALDIPDDLFAAFNEYDDGQLAREFLASQVEIVSKPCANITELTEHLYILRKRLSTLATQYGYVPVVASTLPATHWQDQKANDSKRYHRLADALAIAARRMSVCGMHVHTGVEDIEKRLYLYNELRWYLPYLLALSCSSPFWAGQQTEYYSYRLSVIDGLPRSGLPLRFSSVEAYKEYINTLVNTGDIGDASEIWWDLRMSCRFPTIEMRISDVCPLVEDTIAIAAFYQCLAHWLLRTERENLDKPALMHNLVAENRWRVQRYGLRENALIDLSSKALKPLKAVYQGFVEMLAEDAKILDCQQELEHILTICERGTSADRQIAIYQDAIAKGASTDAALKAVVEGLVLESQGKLSVAA